MRPALIVLLLAGTAAASPLQDLDTARRAFQTKDCGVAMPYLKNVLKPVTLSDRDDIFEAHVMLGACEVDNNQIDYAKDEFRSALQLYPDKDLDPLYYSTSSVRVYEDTKAEVAAEAAKAAAEREKQRAKEELQKRLADLRVYEHHHYYQVFLPFGSGQFQNSDNVKGTILAATELAAFSTSVGIWYYLVNKYGVQSTNVALADASTVRRLQEIEIGSGVAFFVLWAYGVYDANRNFKHDVVVPGSEQLLKDLDQPVARPKPKKTSIRWGPILVPSGAGLGVAWEN